MAAAVGSRAMCALQLISHDHHPRAHPPTHSPTHFRAAIRSTAFTLMLSLTANMLPHLAPLSALCSPSLSITAEMSFDAQTPGLILLWPASKRNLVAVPQSLNLHSNSYPELQSVK